MALAVEEGKLPLVLPSSVARVTANGLPTKHLIDWEQLTRHWYKANAVALDTRLTEVKSETDANTAAITEEATARTSADEALALQITEVTATVDDATANGQIYFAAKAAPGGAVAAYGLYLTAGSTFTGMELIADSGGGASIAFAANDFKLTDSGTAQNVFNYSSGVFTFNVPVRIGTVDVAAGAISNMAQTVNSDYQATVVMACRAGANISIIATLKGSGSNSVTAGAAGSSMTIYANGSVVDATSVNFVRDINGTNQIFFLNSTTLQAQWVAPFAGTFSFQVVASHSIPYGAAIVVTELAR